MELIFKFKDVHECVDFTKEFNRIYANKENFKNRLLFNKVNIPKHLIYNYDDDI
ncbi:TPA: hypothetical protein ACKOR7_001683 [Clostridioides difficile]